MKKQIIILAGLFCFILAASAQEKVEGKKIPSVNIKTLKGELFNTSNIDNNGKPIVISFWALWCKPCLQELTAIADVYEDWQKETGVKIIAVSIDDARSQPNVQPTVNGNGWTYEVYCDPNGDFKRAMGVNVIPHLFVLNGNKEIVYQHTSYAEGSEAQLFDIIKKVAKGEKVTGDK
jgi:cytochrome c biogenesis protein CcmG/thiol:disulfide interchange protein DsbE